jgi:hypothetical protein
MAQPELICRGHFGNDRRAGFCSELINPQGRSRALRQPNLKRLWVPILCISHLRGSVINREIVRLALDPRGCRKN